MLITQSDFLHLFDEIGGIYSDTQPGIDAAHTRTLALDAYLSATAFPSDLDQLTDYHAVVKGIVGTTTATSAIAGTYTGAFGSGGFGVSSSLINAGQGLVSRTYQKAALFAAFEAINTLLRRYNDTGDASIIDMPTYAAHYNALTAYSVLFNAATAAARYLAHNNSNQLAATTVFAPTGISLGHFTITGAGTGTLAAALPIPVANGSAQTVPLTASTQTLVTGQQSAVVSVTGNVAGITGNVVVSGLDMSGSPATDTIALNGTATVKGAVTFGSISSIQFPTRTHGTGDVVTVTFTDNNGYAVYPGGLPMAQGFAPIHSFRARATTAVTGGDGSAVLTLTALNQDGASKTWTANVGSLTAGNSVAFGTTGGATAGATDRVAGNPTGITVAGLATAGVLVLEAVAER